MGDVLCLGGCLSVTALALLAIQLRVSTQAHAHPQQSDHVPAGVFYVKHTHLRHGLCHMEAGVTSCTRMSPSVSPPLVCSRDCPVMSLAYTLAGGISLRTAKLGLQPCWGRSEGNPPSLL